MKKNTKGKFIKIFIDGADKYNGQPLHEAIIDELKSNSISGATIIRGIEGFGEEKKIHTDFLEVLARRLPIVIEIVAEEARVERVIEVVSPMIQSGKIAVLNDVDIITFCNE